MDQQKNLILAIVISAAILLGYQFFLAPKAPPPSPSATTQTETHGPAPQAPGAATATAKIAPRATVLAATPRVKIETPRLSGSINLIGGKIDDLTLTTYHETTNPNSPEIVLLAPDGTRHPYSM